MARRKKIPSKGVRFQGGSGQGIMPQSFSGYAGANHSIKRGHIYWNTLDSRLELDSFSREELLRRCRWLRGNVGFFKGILGNASMLIGWLTPRVRSEDEEWNELANASIKARLMQKNVFDAAGKYNFKTAQRMITEKVLCDADLLTVFTASAAGGSQYAFYESHQLRSPKGADPKLWRDGVRINPQTSRHVAYGVGEGKLVKTISARDAHYFGFFESPGHHRAHPPAAHAVNHAIDITEVWSDTKLGIKNSALLGIISEMDSGAQRQRSRGGMEVTAPLGFEASRMVNSGVGSGAGSGSGLGSGAAGSRVGGDTPKTVKTEEVWGGGQVVSGEPGEKFSVITDGRPHPNQGTFVETLIRDIAMGLRLPPEVLWHMQKLTGPGVRYIMEMAGRWIEEKQLELLDWCHRVVVYHLSLEIKAGRLPEPPDDKWLQKIAYIPRRSLTIDRGKESQQRMNEIYAGAGTLGDWYADIDGADGRDKMGQRIREVAWAKKECLRVSKAEGVTVAYEEVFRSQQGAAAVVMPPAAGAARDPSSGSNADPANGDSQDGGVDDDGGDE